MTWGVLPKAGRWSAIAAPARLVAWSALGLLAVTLVTGDGPSLVRLFDGMILQEEEVLFGSSEPDDRFGDALVSIDFNGDGTPDLAVGAPGEAPGADPASGVVFGFQGSGGNLTQWGFGTLDEIGAGGTNGNGDRFGAALGSGDFNNDGFGDLAIGAPGEPNGALLQAGAVSIYRGGGKFSSGAGSFKQEQAGGASEAGDEFGSAIAAGDFNGDGFDDVAVGAPGEELAGAPSAGALYVFPGTSSGFAPGSAVTQETVGRISQAGDQLASSLAAADFDEDGYTDLAVGVPGEPASGASASGAVLVLAGSPAGLVFRAWITQPSAGEADEAGDQFGHALAVGDLNGDGQPDLAVSAPGQTISGAAEAGMVCSLLGQGTSLTPGGCVTEATSGAPVEAAARFGSAIASGDLDDDGDDDFIVGAPGSALGGPAGSGAVFVFAGASAGLMPADRLVEGDLGHASTAGDGLGSSLAVGDFDADGAADIAAGAPEAVAPTGHHSGLVFIFPGRSLSPRLTSGPIVGAVTDGGARIWIRADRPCDFAVEFKTDGAAWPGTTTPVVSISGASDLTGVVGLSGLAPATTYQYRPVLNGQAQAADEGSFRTLPPAGQPGIISFAFGADTRFDLGPFAPLQSVRARRPDFLLLMGDQIYADQVTVAASNLQAYARRYRQMWREPTYRAVLREVPTFMTWDDHEIADDWDQGASGRYIPARQAFDLYQGSHNPSPRIAGALYYVFDAGQASFYVLDTRTFRSPRSAPDNASKTMLGSTQKADLKQWLTTSPKRFKFVVSSVMLNDHGTTGSDSWSGYQTERAEILGYIRSNHVCGVVFLSGDQHWTGVFRLEQVAPYFFHEFSPTPLGTAPRPKTTDTGPDILFKYDGGRVYGLMTLNTLLDPPVLSFDAFDNGDHGLFHLDLGWADLCPDSDGDLVLDDEDCSPEDAEVWALPSEVLLGWMDPETLAWSPAASSGGTAQPVYDLLASTSPSDFTGQATACLASDTATLAATDAGLPAPGTCRYYLVRAENGCGGTLGAGSSGVERLGRLCP